MPYSEFKTLDQVTQKFGLSLCDGFQLLQPFQLIEPSNRLKAALEEEIGTALAIDTKKARSELIIVPILKDIRERFVGQISYFSGLGFNLQC